MPDILACPDGVANVPSGMRPGRLPAVVRLPLIEILFLCTGNICRSPAAEAMLRHRLGQNGVHASVRSAGLLDGGQPASAHGVDVLAELGIDLSRHRSQGMTPDLLRSADLILAMAREHVREAVVMAPDVFSRTFTLKELVRRAQRVGPRQPDQPLREWLERVHAGRMTRELMGRSQEDDVADPIGQPRRAYERMVSELDLLLDQAVWLVWGSAQRGDSERERERAS
jgi:protein-tyrosine phosphatase